MLKLFSYHRIALVAAALCVLVSCAQNGPIDSNVEPNAEGDTSTKNTTQAGFPEAKTEHLQVEDDNARIDERRVRGETQSIEVKPQGNLPTYEVTPNSPAKNPADKSGGQSRWRILSF